jgi:glycolate oxidase FAD binding subunit
MAAGRRPGLLDDAILGTVPEVVCEPTSVSDAADALRECAAEGRSVVFLGGGTDIGIGAPPEALGAVLRTGKLSRVVEYAPADQIVTVEAGITLDALQERLRGQRQRLALDPPLGNRATLGGLIAANGFGPLRTRYGTSRDLIVGVTLVRADGVVARGGGKVVKNVAGFDLPRLMVGSLGTLGLIATATFRLHPLPEVVETIVITNLTAAGVRRLVARIKGAQVEPAAIAATGVGPFELGVRFEGFGAAVISQRDRLLGLTREADAAYEHLGAAGEGAFWQRHDALRTAGTLRLKMTALPTQFEKVREEAFGPLAAVLESAGFVGYPTLGIGFLSGTPRDDRAAAAVGAARTALERLGGSLVIHAAPPEIRMQLDAWGTPPPAIALMRSLKERLDPSRRLGPGRFVGGI